MFSPKKIVSNPNVERKPIVGSYCNHAIGEVQEFLKDLITPNLQAELAQKIGYIGRQIIQIWMNFCKAIYYSF